MQLNAVFAQEKGGSFSSNSTILIIVVQKTLYYHSTQLYFSGFRVQGSGVVCIYIIWYFYVLILDYIYPASQYLNVRHKKRENDDRIFYYESVNQAVHWYYLDHGPIVKSMRISLRWKSLSCSAASLGGTGSEL